MASGKNKNKGNTRQAKGTEESKETASSLKRNLDANGSSRSMDSYFTNKYLFFCALGCFIANFFHTSSMFERDRHFSHLSTLEREMTFRTEMGFYYSHYKTLVEAPTFLHGLNRLEMNNATEFPSVINSMERFNILPEMIIAGAYRSFMSLCKWLDVELIQCWQIQRPHPLPKVLSCVGLGDPMNFYVTCAFLMAGLTAAFIFLSGALLSQSLLGGMISIACFFYNHSEATRVMWTPPLRETFAFPFSLLVNILITSIVRKTAKKRAYTDIILLALPCFLYISFWQFSQYTLMVSLITVYLLYTIEAVRDGPLITVLMGITAGFLHSLVVMYTNRMLLTSMLAASICAVLALYIFIENIFNVLPAPYNRTLQASFIFMSTLAMKAEFAAWLGQQEDTHIYNLLSTKYSNYSDFHTKLYTCADEFDFLPLSTYYKLTYTLLVPLVIAVICAVIVNISKKLVENFRESLTSKGPLRLWLGVDVGVLYNIAVMAVYLGMAILVMRLKLFMVPQLCILASLISVKSYWQIFMPNEKKRLLIIFGLLGAMSIHGVKNLQEQRSIVGEYSNPQLEELLEWTKANTAPDAVFAGSMSTMGNVMLSTGRAVVNHPHYETAEVRLRTRLVYSVFSRSPANEVYEILHGLQINYVILDRMWCFKFNHHKPGCAMVDLWDSEKPEYKTNNQPELCPILFDKNPAPFDRVFKNDAHVVLQVPSKYVQIPQPKSMKS